MSSELDDRIFAYLNDEIDEPGLLALERSLRDDADAAPRFARFCRREAALAALLREPGTAAPEPASRRPAGVRQRRGPFASPASRWLAVAATLLIGVAWLLVVGTGSPSAIARVTDLSGSATARRGGDSVTIHAGEALRAGDRIVVDAASRATVALADGTELALDADTTLVLPENGSHRIVLVRGTLSARVAHQVPGDPLVVTTAHGVAEVVGTRLRMVAAASSTRLEVTEGRVRLTRTADQAAVLVDAGCAATAVADASAALTVERLVHLAEHLPAGARVLLRMDSSVGRAGWEGELGVPSDARAGALADIADGPLAIGSIRPQPGTRFMGEIRSPPLVGVVSGEQSYLALRYRAEGFRPGDLVKCMLKSADGADYHGFVVAESGGWREVVIRLDGAFVNLEDHAVPLRPGVPIAQIVLLGAAPDARIAPAGPRLWLDEAVAFTAPGTVAAVAVEQK